MKKLPIILYFFMMLLHYGVYAQIQFKSETYNEIENASDIKIMGSSGSYNDNLTPVVYDKWDYMVANPDWELEYKLKQVKSYVKVGILQNKITNSIANYSYQINLQISGYDDPQDISAPDIQTISLRIAYNKDSLMMHPEQHKVMLNKGYLNFTVKILDIVTFDDEGFPTSVPKSTLAENFYIESGIVIQRIDKTAPPPLYTGSAFNASAKMLNVYWSSESPSGGCVNAGSAIDNFKPGAYELEWTFVEDYVRKTSSGIEYKFSASSYNVPYTFKNNSTRIQTDKTSFSIPLVYEHGAIIFRVRRILVNASDYSKISYGEWSLAESGTITHSSASCQKIFINTTAHENDQINYQYSISFAEQGKFKNVVSYFDGTGKGRQTLTKLQSDAEYVIAMDNVYDYEGRPAIKTLPTPVQANSLNYLTNLSLNSATGLPYKAADFDLGCLNDSIAPFSSTSLAGQYYSATNPDKSFMQKFVPDAEGYPFIETIYAPDNTNKVLWQGGAGISFQRWKGRGTRMLYGRANQYELNRLLGSESGKFEFYPKQVTIDPNGQASYTIYNQKGNVVATSLMGGSPDTSLYPILPLETFQEPNSISYDILKNLSPEIDINLRAAEHTFVAEAGGVNSLQYKAIIPSFNTLCGSKFINIAPRIKIDVFDDCGNIQWTKNEAIGTSELRTGSLTQTLPFTAESFSLNPEKYTIRKELYFPDTAITRLADDFVAASTGLDACFKNVDIFIRNEVDNTEFPCEAINEEESECSRIRKQMISEMYPGAKYGEYIKTTRMSIAGSDFSSGKPNSIFTQIPEVLSEATCKYKIIYKGCYLCESELDGDPPPGSTLVDGGELPHAVITSMCDCDAYECEDWYSYEQWLTPEQKALVEATACFHILYPIWDSCIEATVSTNYRYQSDCISPMSVTVPSFFGLGGGTKLLADLTPGELIRSFTPAIAEALLPLHPEYCKMQQCDDSDFKSILEGVSTYEEAESMGMHNLSGILLQDPFNNAIHTGAPFSPYELSHFPEVADLSAPNAGLLKRIDTMAMEMAYCGCNAAEPILYCKSVQYKSQIESMALPDSKIKNLYFAYLKKNYLALRARLYQQLLDGTYNTCEPCGDDRMEVIAPASFSSFTNPEGTALSSDMDSMPDFMQTIFNDVLSGTYTDTDIPFGLRDTINKQSKDDCLLQVEEIMNGLANCGMTLTKYNAVKTALTNLYCNASSYLSNHGNSFTPDDVYTILVAQGVGINDLCHPFLAAYNINDHRDQYNSGGLVPKNPGFYDGLQTFLDRAEVKNALLNASASGSAAYTISLDVVNNLFEQELGTILSYTSGTVSLKGFESSIFEYYDDYYGENKYRNYCKLAITHGSLSDTLYFTYRNKQSATSFAGGSYIPNLRPTHGGASGVTIQFGNVQHVMADVKYKGMVDGLLADNLVFATMEKNTPLSPLQKTDYNIWGKIMTMFNPANLDAPEDCITCIELKKHIDTFKLNAGSYGYTVFNNSPVFDRTLKNYLNYKTGKRHTFIQYQNLMQGCAVSDKVLLPNTLSNISATFAGYSAAESFVSALHVHFDDLRVGTVYSKTGTDIKVDFDLTTIPFQKIKSVKDYILTYAASAVYQPVAPATAVGSIWVLPPSVAPVLSGATVTSSVKQYKLADGSIVNMDVYNITTAATDPLAIASVINDANEYLTLPGVIPVQSFYNYQLYRSEDYNLPEKQEFLSYIYSLEDEGIYEARNAMGRVPLQENLTLLSAPSLYFGFSNPYCPNVKTNLYYYRKNQTDFSGYNKLLSVINTVKSELGSNKLFPTAPETSLSATALGAAPYTSLKVFRLQNGGVWYRFFDAANKLHNIYIDGSEYMIGAPETYTMSPGTSSINLIPGADSIYHFTVQMQKGTSPPHIVTLKGYTDFPIGVGGKLDHVVLYDSKGQDGCAVTPCETTTLDNAVTAATILYDEYIDSIRNSYYNKMRNYYAGATTDELIHTTMQQQYHHTLYYYDLVGNLTRTVPPKGVTKVDPSLFTTIDNNRPAGSLTHKASNTKVSTYRYNSLNQVVSQQTPDGGLTKFFYDKAGRLVFSQNAKQAAATPPKYSYTLYDNQGRIYETGVLLEVNTADQTFINASWEKNNTMISGRVNSKSREEVVVTKYDRQLLNLEAFTGLSPQQNLRKRVSTILYAPFVTASTVLLDDTVLAENYYTYATHFSYDALGNVDMLVHDNPYMDYLNQRFKRVDYEYDLHSGKVNMLSYNRGAADQFYQRYTYDADNRIEIAESSKDGIIWDKEAEYEYYKHGPLARVSLGRLNVQQMEYAYTIQGWLKSVNGDALNPEDDMGQGLDGPGLLTQDVMVHSLDYFDEDYKPIGTTPVSHKPESARLSHSLYNGNIARQTTGMVGMDNLQRDYTYDQLHRIKSTHYSNFDNITHTVSSLAASYRNAYSYDPDGNITQLTRRNGAGVLIDSFLYSYQAATNNKLDRVTDRVTTSTATGDLKHGQTAGNYTYDQLGNLLTDRQEHIRSIDWNAYGKMTSLAKGTEEDDTMLLAFQYDGTGQRIRKDYLSSIEGTEDYARSSDVYVRDASGNILAVYKGRSVIGGGPYIEWLLDDVLTGTGGWSSTVASGFPYFFELYYGGVAGVPLIKKALALNSSWVSTKIAANPTRYYLEHSKPLLTTMMTANPVFPVVSQIRQEEEDLIPGMLARKEDAGLQFMTSVLSQNQGNALPVIAYYVAETPSNAAALLAAYGKSAHEMTDTQQVLFILNQYYTSPSQLVAIYMQSLQNSPEPFYKALFNDTVLVDSVYFASYNMQNQTNADFFLNLFTKGVESSLAPVDKFAEQYGNWIDVHAPGILAQYAPPLELAGVIYNVSPKVFISDFGTAFGTAHFGKTILDISGLSALGFHKKLEFHYGPGGITGSTYTPPDVSTPSPGSLLGDTLSLAEHHLYGSSRLGIVTYPETQYRVVYGGTEAADTSLLVRKIWYSGQQDDWMKADKASIFTGSTYNTAVDTASTLHHIGLKHYELSDHLGNVMVTLTDKRTGFGNNSGNFTGWHANVLSVNDYYPFGMQIEERSLEHTFYRFSHNTQERTDEIAGKGNHHTAEFWEYSPRIAKRWNVDPKPNVSISPYATFGNNPVLLNDILGDTTWVYSNNGKLMITITDDLDNQIHFMDYNVHKDYKAQTFEGMWANVYREASTTYIGSNTIADFERIAAHGEKINNEVGYVAMIGFKSKELRLYQLSDKYGSRSQYNMKDALKSAFSNLIDASKYIFATGHFHPSINSHVSSYNGATGNEAKFRDLGDPTGTGSTRNDYDYKPYLLGKKDDELMPRQHTMFINSKFGITVYGSGDSWNDSTKDAYNKIEPTENDKYKYQKLKK